MVLSEKWRDSEDRVLQNRFPHPEGYRRVGNDDAFGTRTRHDEKGGFLRAFGRLEDGS